MSRCYLGHRGLTCLCHSHILANVMAELSHASEAEESCEVFVFDEGRVGRARNALLGLKASQDVAALFKMLANPTRAQILKALEDQELCVCDLAQVLDLSVSATSHQLQLLRGAKLVRYRKEGKFAYYRVADEFVLAMLQDGLAHLEREKSAS